MSAPGFLPNLQESIMDELRTNEGGLFRDELVKKLFIDVKELCMTCLGTAKKAFADDMYDQVLERYAAWDEAVSHGVMDKAQDFPDAESRLLPSCVLYAKLLYGTYGGTNDPITIKKPSLQTLLKGMMTRLAKQRLVFNGTFYELDPLRQDYALRDIFRQALYDCIEIVDEDTKTNSLPSLPGLPSMPSKISSKASVAPSIAPSVKPASVAQNSNDEALDGLGPLPTAEQGGLGDDDEIYPDDSISRVMENLSKVVTNQKAASVPPSVIQMEGAGGSKVSSASRVTTGTKTMRLPVDVRRVTIDNEDKH